MRIRDPRSTELKPIRTLRATTSYRFGLAVLGVAIWVSVVPRSPDGSAADGHRLVDLRAIPDSVLTRSRVVVLEVDAADSADLWANPTKRGRRWERPARAVFLSNGAVTLETPVGLRIHGGHSRVWPAKSLRLSFRHSLGAVHPTGDQVGLAGDRRHQTLVLHADVRPDTGALQFHYSDPIAYAVANRLGVMVPSTVPATLVINGGTPQPYVITEHLSRRNLEAWLGTRELAVYDVRDDWRRLRTEGPLAELWDRFGPMEGWTLEQVAQVVDVENMSQWFMTVLFCGTRDTHQGVLIRDPRRPSAFWYWIARDLDLSFDRTAAVAPGQPFDLRFLTHPDYDAYQGHQGAGEEARMMLLRHLLRTSEPYRRQLTALFVAARDSLLSPEFLDQTLASYEGAAVEHGIPDMRDRALIRAYLARRPAVLRDQFNTFLDADLP